MADPAGGRLSSGGALAVLADPAGAGGPGGCASLPGVGGCAARSALLREALDAAERNGQRLRTLEDGNFDTLGMGKGLPERTVLVVRTVRNRRGYRLPQARPNGVGRPRRYGERTPQPAALLRQRQGWQRRVVTGRGRKLTVR